MRLTLFAGLTVGRNLHPLTVAGEARDDDRVLAGPALDRRRAGTDDRRHDIVARPGVNRGVAARNDANVIVAKAAGDGRRDAVALQKVVAVAAQDRVRAAAAVNRVVARAAADEVRLAALLARVARVASQHVVAGEPVELV